MKEWNVIDVNCDLQATEPAVTRGYIKNEKISCLQIVGLEVVRDEAPAPSVNVVCKPINGRKWWRFGMEEVGDGLFSGGAHHSRS